jgi:hypothetical protein
MEKQPEREAPDVLTSDTNNATTIQPEEAAPHKRPKFRRLRAYNTGTWNGPKRENTEVRRRQDDLARYDSISSSLNLTSYQKKRGRVIFDELDFHQFGGSIDKIIFGVCAVVANDDVDDGKRYWPSDGPSDSNFSKVADSIGLDWKGQISAINKVMWEVDF